MKHRLDWIFSTAVAALLATGCGTNDPGLSVGTGGTGGTRAMGGSAGATASGTSTGGTSGGKGNTTMASDICSGKGPIVTIPGKTTSGSYQTCTGRIAETRFVNALCTCKNASIAGYLRTRAFDSAHGTSVDQGGSVGINQSYLNSAGFSDIGGSFSIAGHDSLSLAGYLKVGADFRAQGSATVAGYTNIGRNMWLGSGFTDLGPVTVAGDLHASGAVMAIPLMVSGARYQESVSVAPPCPCQDKDILDVAALVADAKVHNDNATAGIVPSMFNTLIGYATATLPCGKFYIEEIGGIGDVIINVTGRAALFVDGSIKNTGNLEFRLGPSAEIDIFIRDNLAIVGRATFGQKERPAASRVYVGGDGNVMLVGDGEFVGNLYAPRSLVQVVGYGAFRGSLFAGDFVCPGYADFAYDLAIKSAGDPCTTPIPPPGTCTQCGTCTGGTACVGGTCGACRSDADCCSQISVPSAAPSEQPPPPADLTAGEATVAPNPADVGAPARPAAAESPSPAARQRSTAPARAGRASATSPGIATVTTVSTDTVLGTTSVDEFRLLRAARQALAERPARALELTDEHARRFARGMLSQEREAIAVDALVQLGREGQARTRAQAFLGAYPSSPYRSRVERALGHAVGAGNKP